MVSAAPNSRATSRLKSRREMAMTRQQGTKKANTDDRHRLPGVDVGPLEDVEGAAERFARKRLVGEFGRQLHHLVGVGDVMAGIAVVAEGRDAVAGRETLDPFADCLDHAPAFMAHPAGLTGILKPFGAAPGAKIRGANAATFDAEAQLAGSGIRQGKLVDADRLRRRQGGGAHGGGGQEAPLRSTASTRRNEDGCLRLG
jgi:hypothetical protein